MALITKRLLHLRPALPHHPYSIQHSTSSSSDGPSSTVSETESGPRSYFGDYTPNKTSFSSKFSDVKASLQREPPPQNRIPRPSSVSNHDQPRLPDLQEIRRNLAEFRTRSAPPSPSSSGFVTFQEIYKRNFVPKDDESPDSTHSPGSLDAIRDSIRRMTDSSSSSTGRSQVGSGGKPFGTTPFPYLKDSLKMKSQPNSVQSSSMIIGGSQSFSPPISELLKRGRESDSSATTSMLLARSYNYSELGEKLKMLRPEKKKGKWFMLQELTERLVKLKEMEDKENNVFIGSVKFRNLREGLQTLHVADLEVKRKKMIQSLDVLSQLGATPAYMLHNPQEHLVEKYFHPDNMSSEKKMKLQLKKVRDEFKMSESDCGSARVQVAQLTTKIKHLSTVLHKKDKHSRRGLEAMVQRRKKLLKYLRRTDWDSYSLVLSKLGLRDNTTIKA